MDKLNNMAIHNPFKKMKFKVDKFYTNKRNGQMTVVIPRKKFKRTPTRIKLEVSYW